MLDNKQLWDNAIVEIELGVSKANFITWFKNTFIYKIDDGIVFISVPNAFVKDWLLNKYHKVILRALRNLNPSIRGLEYTINREQNKKPIENRQEMKQNSMNAQLGLENHYTNKEDNLNPRYTFESFIVGQFNELAHAASQAVINKPGTTYNPLFIYGGTGLGKTHLIQSIGNTLKAQNKRVFYLTSEKYATELIDSIKNNTISNFKEKYRKYDLLIIDDVQFFSGKEKIQEEFFHLFNSLYDNNKQIIFSSDRPPSNISNIEDRLISRFEGGMIVDVSKPDYESRMAILSSKSKSLGVEIDKDIVDYIATNVKENIRELEGVLNAVICRIQLQKRDPTIPELKSLIKTSVSPQKTISIKDVVKIVSDFYNIEEKYVYEKTRRKEVVKPRQISMYILREDFDISYPYIGQKMGGRDHTTVIHACEKIKREIQSDTVFAQDIENIKNMINNKNSSLNATEGQT